MDTKRQCAVCGRQFDDSYQFCPFDASPLAKKCPTCGQLWDNSFRFCPLDSAALAPLRLGSAAEAPQVEPIAPPSPPPATATPVASPYAAAPSASYPAAPPVVTAPPIVPPAAPHPVVSAPAAPPSLAPAAMAPAAAVSAPSAYAPKPTAFTFADQVAKPSWKEIALRPMTIFVACGVTAIAFFVWYLNFRTSGGDLPLPTMTYTLLPNKGETKGVPVAIKINQATVFMIDDPMDGGGAARAKKIIASLDETMRPLKADPNAGGIRFAVDDRRPVILVISQASGDKKELATVTEGDVTLAGDNDAMHLAGQWAERLTDAVKVFAFGEVPSFSMETEFGQALLSMFKQAAGSQGKVSKQTLDAAFQRLSAGQRHALEAPPTGRRASAESRSR